MLDIRCLRLIWFSLTALYELQSKRADFQGCGCHLGLIASDRFWLFCMVRSWCRALKNLDQGLPAANNFLKGASFSPDGTCLLTSSDDTVLRVFEVPNQVLRGVRYRIGPPCVGASDWSGSSPSISLQQSASLFQRFVFPAPASKRRLPQTSDFCDWPSLHA